MLLHLGTDSLCTIEDNNISLLGRDIDKTVPEHLHKYFSATEHTTLWVLNGPGSFTNTRVGCLAVNTLLLFRPDLQIFHSNKLDLYTQLYQKKLLSRYCLMYIGQRKNYRLFDCATQSKELVAITEAKHISDMLINHAIDQHDFSIDFLTQQQEIVSSYSMIEYHLLSKHTDFFPKQETKLEAYYGVELLFTPAQNN